MFRRYIRKAGFQSRGKTVHGLGLNSFGEKGGKAEEEMEITFRKDPLFLFRRIFKGSPLKTSSGETVLDYGQKYGELRLFKLLQDEVSAIKRTKQYTLIVIMALEALKDNVKKNPELYEDIDVFLGLSHFFNHKTAEKLGFVLYKMPITKRLVSAVRARGIRYDPVSESTKQPLKPEVLGVITKNQFLRIDFTNLIEKLKRPQLKRPQKES